MNGKFRVPIGTGAPYVQNAYTGTQTLHGSGGQIVNPPTPTPDTVEAEILAEVLHEVAQNPHSGPGIDWMEMGEQYHTEKLDWATRIIAAYEARRK